MSTFLVYIFFVTRYYSSKAVVPKDKMCQKILLPLLKGLKQNNETYLFRTVV